MLILTRKNDESFYIGDDIRISIMEVNGDKVKIAIEAPKEFKILRSELKELEEINQEAAKINQLDIDAIKNLIK